LETGASLEPLVWQTAPRASGTGKKVVTGLGILLPFVWGLSVREIVLGLVGSALVATTVVPMFLPVKYRLDEKSASAGVLLGVSSMEWEAVKKVRVFEDRIHLSPFGQETRLDETRGVWLNVSGDNRDAVLAYVKDRVQKDVGFLGGGDVRGGHGDAVGEDRNQNSLEENGGTRGDGA